MSVVLGALLWLCKRCRDLCHNDRAAQFAADSGPQ